LKLIRDVVKEREDQAASDDPLNLPNLLSAAMSLPQVPQEEESHEYVDHKKETREG